MLRRLPPRASSPLPSPRTRTRRRLSRPRGAFRLRAGGLRCVPCACARALRLASLWRLLACRALLAFLRRAEHENRPAILGTARRSDELESAKATKRMLVNSGSEDDGPADDDRGKDGGTGERKTRIERKIARRKVLEAKGSRQKAPVPLSLVTIDFQHAEAESDPRVVFDTTRAALAKFKGPPRRESGHPGKFTDLNRRVTAF
mmetsp:Transcript_17629/g.43035  ORF Transcript_17629/g.43035 Transcript_17629/m.43035 type:complete len:204 (+) Transcript_17629:418-1029(+)